MIFFRKKSQEGLHHPVAMQTSCLVPPAGFEPAPPP